MKKIYIVLILLILPVLLIILAFAYKYSIGPYYLGAYYYPAYNYLLNSLNISQGHKVGNFDHPGTPFQVLGALVIKIFYMLDGNGNDIAKDVFSRPEIYLNKYFFSSLFINAFALFLLGYISFKKLKNIKAAILLQLTPFFSSSIYFVAHRKPVRRRISAYRRSSRGAYGGR